MRSARLTPGRACSSILFRSTILPPIAHISSSSHPLLLEQRLSLVPRQSPALLLPLKTSTPPFPIYSSFSTASGPSPKPDDLYTLDLQNTKRVFRKKATSSLLSSYLVFTACFSPTLVSRVARAFNFLDRRHLAGPLYFLFRHTFYPHFIAGENFEDTTKKVKWYWEAGVKSILDYSVEDAFSPAEWEANTQRLLASVKNVGSTYQSMAPFVPLKVTGLCSPKLLERMTSLILYNQLSIGEVPVPWLQGQVYPKSPAFPHLQTTTPPKAPEPLSPEEEKQLKDAFERLRLICNEAKKFGLALLCDAEQTYRQPAINHLARIVSMEFNKENAILFNTFQLYLKGNLQNLRFELDLAKNQKFKLGAKIVRGAYLSAETKKSKENGYPMPVQDTKADTDAAYNAAVKLLLSNLSDAAVMIAGHNAESTQLAMTEMKQLGISPNDKRVHFAQLMGMCDDITLALGDRGFNVHKLLPYGPIHNVLPYLLRRLEENSSILGGTYREKRLIRKELKNRILSASS